MPQRPQSPGTPSTGDISSAKLALVASQTNNSVIITDAQGHIEWVNTAFTTLTGWSLADCLEKRPGHFLQGPETDPDTRARMAACLRSGNGFTEELLNYRKDGSSFWLAMEVRPVRDASGQLVQFIGVGTDISFRRKTESALRDAHAENELIISTISAGLIGLDINERVSRWNDAAERIFGLPRELVLGRVFGEIGIQLDWADLILGMNRCLTEGRAIDLHNIYYRRPNGESGTLDLNIVSSWAGGDGSDGLGMIITVTDSTDRKQELLQKQQSQKMESIGQLAAGIAHEINTPIQFIGDNLRFLDDGFRDLSTVIRELTDLLDRPHNDSNTILQLKTVVKKCDFTYLDTEIPKAIQQSLEGVERVAGIVKAMKEFSHPDQGERKAVDLNRAILTTLTVARNEYKYVAELETNFAIELPPVPCFIGEINQVILNLVVNAAHAIADTPTKGRGRISVKTSMGADEAIVAITDTGTGIPPAIQTRIFDPFFTTKGVGKGTGQGLYIAHTVIVKKHGGKLYFSSTEGIGTTFFIHLPLHPEHT